MSPSIEAFDEAKYEALMDGLECTEIPFSQVNEGTVRLDSEYYKKEVLAIDSIIAKMNGNTIEELGGVVDCSAFYPSITGYYSNDRNNIPFLRVNELQGGLVSITGDTVFLPQYILDQNEKTIAIAFPGDIIIAKGGNTLAKVGLVTEEFPRYSTCRDVITLRTGQLSNINRFYLWAYLHSKYGQGLMWRSASQTGQPHITIQSILKMKVPAFSEYFQSRIMLLYSISSEKMNQSKIEYEDAVNTLSRKLSMDAIGERQGRISIEQYKDSYGLYGRLDAEYYQPKYTVLMNNLRNHNCQTLSMLTSIKKSIEPGSEAYCETGIPFVRVRDVSKFGITPPEIFISPETVANPQLLFPKKDTILFSKDGSVGIAYKMESDEEMITSGALLHLNIRNQSTILPDYLTLVLNSPVVQMQAERDSNGAIIQHWKPSEIEAVQIPVLEMETQQALTHKVQKSFALRNEAAELIDAAKQAVEIAIEKGEQIAIDWLAQKEAE